MPSSPLQEDKIAGLPCPNSSASFWHSEPSTFLLGHRTTAELPSEADFVVIGSGITGASAALFLAEDERAKNSTIVMLEAREACWGATGRNGGHCQPLLFDRTPEVAAFELKNVATVRSYIEKHNVPCEWQDVVGCRTYWDKKLLSAVQDEIKQLRKSSPDIGKQVEVITDAASLQQHRVAKHAAGATLTQGAASLWPYKYVAFILEKLVKEGRLNLQTNTPVTLIKPDAASSGSSSSKVIHTPRGSLRAKNIILATNGYTSHILPSFRSLIVPVRCEMSALHPPRDSAHLPDSYGFVGAKGQNPAFDDYLVQRPFYESSNGDGTRRGGHLMFGGGRGAAQYQCVGVTDDDIVDEGEAAYLRQTLLELLDLGGEVAALKELPASHQWTGIKGYSRDDMPWVGKVEEHGGVWLCGGYTGHGMPNATLCGKAIVDMVLSTQVSKESYATVCRRLVDAGDLPDSYIITAERLESAAKLPTVAEQEAESEAASNSKFSRGEKAGRSCTVM